MYPLKEAMPPDGKRVRMSVISLQGEKIPTSFTLCTFIFYISYKKENTREETDEIVFLPLCFGGANQIRTGVNGFADRYLTTRTWHPIFLINLPKEEDLRVQN